MHSIADFVSTWVPHPVLRLAMESTEYPETVLRDLENLRQLHVESHEQLSLAFKKSQAVTQKLKTLLPRKGAVTLPPTAPSEIFSGVLSQRRESRISKASPNTNIKINGSRVPSVEQLGLMLADASVRRVPSMSIESGDEGMSLHSNHARYNGENLLSIAPGGDVIPPTNIPNTLDAGAVGWKSNSTFFWDILRGKLDHCYKMQPGAGDNRLNTATMTLAHINKGWESLISGLQGVDSRPPVTKHSPQVPLMHEIFYIFYPGLWRPRTGRHTSSNPRKMGQPRWQSSGHWSASELQGNHVSIDFDIQLFNCLIEVLRKGSDSHWLGNSHGVPLMRSQMTWARRSSFECQNFCSLVSRKLHHWVKTSENRFISDPQKTFCRSLACSLQFEIISARFTIFIFPNVCKSASHHIAGTPEYLLASSPSRYVAMPLQALIAVASLLLSDSWHNLQVQYFSSIISKVFYIIASALWLAWFYLMIALPLSWLWVTLLILDTSSLRCPLLLLISLRSRDVMLAVGKLNEFLVLWMSNAWVPWKSNV